jgi:hypothetical protein
MLDTIAQIGLFALSVSAILLVARKNKWGFVAGLLAQPFWFLTAYLNGQWGVFLTSAVLTISWAYGVYNWFFKDKKKPK